jgi:hypothetical protein
MHNWMTAEIFRRWPAGDFVEKQEEQSAKRRGCDVSFEAAREF